MCTLHNTMDQLDFHDYRADACNTYEPHELTKLVHEVDKELKMKER